MPKPIDGDLSEKVAIVTGATAGIGFEVAAELARLGAVVVLPCRNIERGRAAEAQIKTRSPAARIELIEADLSSQVSVNAFAIAFLGKHTRLDILVNNAAVWPGTRQLSREKIELTWATNVLAYYLLIEQLREVLVASAPSRIVNVASRMAWGLDLSDVEFERRQFKPAMAYAQSKQADRMMTWALARRLEGTGVTANAAHPGSANTELFRDLGGVFGALSSIYFKLAGRKPARGADTIAWLAASNDVQGETGKWWADRRAGECKYAKDQNAQEELWALCRKMIGA
jgi:NAD(P)-dependent dehydrogenase (short-subunit alcohol dehydrogenase family)